MQKAASTYRRGVAEHRTATLVDLTSFKCLRSAKLPAGRSLFVHIDLRGHGFDLVIDRRQLFILGKRSGATAASAMCGSVATTAATGSPTKRTLSSARIGWVVERRSVIRIGDHLADVFAGETPRARPGMRAGCADVNALYTAVRNGASKNLAVDHARQLHHVGCIRRGPVTLARCLKPGQRDADLAPSRTVYRHRQSLFSRLTRINVCPSVTRA